MGYHNLVTIYANSPVEMMMLWHLIGLTFDQALYMGYIVNKRNFTNIRMSEAT